MPFAATWMEIDCHTEGSKPDKDKHKILLTS